jgi:hypothetical protein
MVRIGANYSPSAKNYYFDPVKKTIQCFVPEVKNRLEHNIYNSVMPATAAE